VFQAVLEDYDVAYSPLISQYGSCTATLMSSPGTVVEVFITYLTKPLLKRMTDTEGAYDLVELKGVKLMEGVSLQDLRSRSLEQYK
jgi:hypothetical protein